MELLQLKQKQVTDAGLSLAPPSSFSSSSFDLFATRMPIASSTSNEISSGSSSVEELDDSAAEFQLKKRKRPEGDDRHRRNPSEQGRRILAGLMQDVDLRHSATPLPPGWEQCLDLQSGEMFYCNPALRIRTRHDPRKGFTPNDWIAAKNTKSAATAALLQTNSYSKKLREEHQRCQAAVESLDLSLNLSSTSLSSSRKQPGAMLRDQSLRDFAGGSEFSSGGHQLAMAACRLCLRFVMLPKSSRSCPYCGSSVL